MKYLGIDWAAREHVAALLDEDGNEIAVWTVRHTWPCVRELLEQLDAEGGPEQVLIGLEPGSPRLTSALLAAGYTVYEINPKSASRFRDRSTPSGAKDDRRDALVLAGAVRTDRHWMRPACPPSELNAELRLRCRDREMHVSSRRRLLVQLHRTLAEYYPALLALEMRLSCGLIRALFRAYPTPSDARRAQKRRLAKLLRSNLVRKIDEDQLQSLLREPTFPMPTSLEQVYVDRTRALLAQLAQVEASLLEAESKIALCFEQHDRHDALLSVPGCGAAMAPYVAAEVATVLGDRPGQRALQATAGTAPRTQKSGRQVVGSVRMRRGCHRGLQTALFTVARCSRAKSAWARSFYADARKRGLSHNMALRALSNKWAKIIAVLLTNNETYDEQRHIENLRRAGVSWAPQETSGDAA